jgi:hypothetical protein
VSIVQDKNCIELCIGPSIGSRQSLLQGVWCLLNNELWRGMLNTLNKLYPKLIYILLHVFALCNSCPPPSKLVLLCKEKHFAILVQLILHHQNLSYLRTNCFLERSIVHC